jgi:OOP family OmpA-OmpF porin
MKNILIIFFCTIFYSTFSQNSDKPYDKWSLEIGIGQAKGLNPYSDGFLSSNPEKYLNFSAVNHYEGGFRYMFSPKFGLKLDAAYDLLKPEESNGSLPFETKHIRIGLQMVFNVGRIMNFETFTKRFGILVHGGIQVHQTTPSDFKKDLDNNFLRDVNGDYIKLGDKFIEDDGGFILGFTPQFRISNTFVLHGDVSYLYNTRQHYTWDGNEKNIKDNLVGTMINASVGITAYIGKKSVHADWYSEDTAPANSKQNSTELDNLRNRLRNVETKMTLDSDKDGIPDYLDGCPFEAGTKENNGCPDKDTDGDSVLDKDDECVTIPGPVENKGCPFSDKDGDKVADKDDACPEDQGPVSNKGCPRVDKKVREKINVLAKNIFFNSGKSDLSPRSVSTLNKIKDIMMQYPNVKFKILGHTDDKGNFDKNMKLSDDRSAAVVNWLGSKGVSTSNLSSEGFGSTKPISTNATEAGRATNRRTEIEIIEQD